MVGAEECGVHPEDEDSINVEEEPQCLTEAEVSRSLSNLLTTVLFICRDFIRLENILYSV